MIVHICEMDAGSEVHSCWVNKCNCEINEIEIIWYEYWVRKQW